MDGLNVTFYNPQFERIFTLSNVNALSMVKTLNRVGTLTIDIPIKFLDIAFSVITQEDLIAIVTVEDGTNNIQSDPFIQTPWLLRLVNESNNDKAESLRLTFKDGLDILKRRINPYNSDDIRSNINAPGNIAMNQIVANNYGITAEPDRRVNELIVRGVQLPSPVIEKQIAYKNIFSSLQQIARTSRELGTRLFFDILVRPNQNSLEFEFVTFVNQRGSNVSNRQLLTTEHHFVNMNSFIIDYDVPNVAYVGGEGRGRERLVGNAVSTRANNGPFSRIEIFKTEQSADLQVLDDEARELVSDAGVYRLDCTLLGDLATSYNFGDILEIQHRDVIVESEIHSVRVDIEAQQIERKLILKSTE